MMTTVRPGYVVTDDGEILVQLPTDNQWGFVLADDDQMWPGGFGVAAAWELLSDSDPRITDDVRDRLGWLLEEVPE